MKKRSLFAAVAMLIVSAVVLTSATYAWFASGSQANIGQIQASISNSDGTLLIATDLTANSGEGNWKTNLVWSDWTGVSGNTGTPGTNAGAQVPTALEPVSFNFNGGATADSKIAGTIQQITTGTNAGKYQFSAGGTASGGFIDLTFYVKATAACVVTVTPTLTATQNFIYGAITSNGTGAAATAQFQAVTAVPQAIRGGSAGYYPVISGTGTAIDANENSIVDAAEDDGGVAGTVISATKIEPDTNSVTFVITDAMATAKSYVTCHLYIWAEGQHGECYGNVTNATANMTVAIAKSGFTPVSSEP